MPGGDRTGPMGMGPMTGRGAGYCAGFPVGGFANPAAGYGFRGGRRGGGRGRRNWFYATGAPGWMRAGSAPGMGMPWGAPLAEASQEVETASLKQQAEFLEQSLDGIRKRIEELEAAAKKE